MVIRLNRPQYDRNKFLKGGVKHVDLYFPDGSIPPDDIWEQFLNIVEKEPGAIAIHCKAGLGRTGTLIGLYCMKHYGFPPAAFTGWIRIARPGSILGPQQQYLVQMDDRMLKLGGEAKRKDLLKMFENLSFQGSAQYSESDAKIAKEGESGQADYLNKAKQNRQGK